MRVQLLPARGNYMTEHTDDAFDREATPQNPNDFEVDQQAQTPDDEAQQPAEPDGEGNEGRRARSTTSGGRKRRKVPASSGAEATEQALQLPQGEHEESEEDLDELEAQGFTRTEALRLIHVSDRISHSSEAREAEAVLRRLRFQRWLLERGLLDEFSA